MGERRVGGEGEALALCRVGECVQGATAGASQAVETVEALAAVTDRSLFAPVEEDGVLFGALGEGEVVFGTASLPALVVALSALAQGLGSVDGRLDAEWWIGRSAAAEQGAEPQKRDGKRSRPVTCAAGRTPGRVWDGLRSGGEHGLLRATLGGFFEAYRDATRGEGLFHLGDGVSSIVEHGGGEYGVGVAFGERFGEVSE